MTVTGASNVKMALSNADDDLDFNPFYKILQVSKTRQRARVRMPGIQYHIVK